MKSLKLLSTATVRALCLAPFVFLLATQSVAYAEGQPPAARGLWTVDWLRPDGGQERSLGFLRLSDGTLSFSLSRPPSGGTPESRPTGWELRLADVKTISVRDNRQLVVETLAGESYAVVTLTANMMPESPKRVKKILDEALAATAGDRRSPRFERK